MIVKLAYLGLAAGGFTTFSFVPQIMKILRTRSTADLSLGMIIVLVIGTALWLFYGLLLADVPLIVANSVTLVLLGTILISKLRLG